MTNIYVTIVVTVVTIVLMIKPVQYSLVCNDNSVSV